MVYYLSVVLSFNYFQRISLENIVYLQTLSTIIRIKLNPRSNLHHSPTWLLSVISFHFHLVLTFVFAMQTFALYQFRCFSCAQVCSWAVPFSADVLPAGPHMDDFVSSFLPQLRGGPLWAAYIKLSPHLLLACYYLLIYQRHLSLASLLP